MEGEERIVGGENRYDDRIKFSRHSLLIRQSLNDKKGLNSCDNIDTLQADSCPPSRGICSDTVGKGRQRFAHPHSCGHVTTRLLD